MTYRNRIGQDGPKRLLALDGGGIRGVLSLEILAAIETCCGESSVAATTASGLS